MHGYCTLFYKKTKKRHFRNKGVPFVVIDCLDLKAFELILLFVSLILRFLISFVPFAYNHTGNRESIFEELIVLYFYMYPMTERLLRSADIEFGLH